MLPFVNALLKRFTIFRQECDLHFKGVYIYIIRKRPLQYFETLTVTFLVNEFPYIT
jgi:hypothetical protein